MRKPTCPSFSKRMVSHSIVSPETLHALSVYSTPPQHTKGNRALTRSAREREQSPEGEGRGGAEPAPQRLRPAPVLVGVRDYLLAFRHPAHGFVNLGDDG